MIFCIMISQRFVLRSSHLPTTSTRLGVPVRRVGVVRATEKEVKCYVNEEGHLVCDRLEPGDYVVKKASEGVTSSGDKPPEGVAFCYITDSGELICEGLDEGNYTIEQASDEHMSDMIAHMQQLTEKSEKIVKEAKVEVVEESKTEEVVEETKTEEVVSKETFDPKTGVRCYVNADGVMVCEKLEPGDYVVKPVPGTKAKSKNAVDEGVTYCYITDDGELLCEGMEEGQYSIEKATDDDLEAMLKHVDQMTQKSTE
eukprot:g1880.t1